MRYVKQVSLIALCASLATTARAQQALPTIEVGGAPLHSAARPPVQTTPSTQRAPAGRASVTSAPATSAPPASPIVRYAVPAATYTITGNELQNTRAFNLPENLVRQAPGVTVNDVAGGPFLPEIDFRGFVASPIAGTPQGLAVYQNGIRINEAWGDNVYWDMIPSVAIDRFTLVTGNPLFGLNAIGGAVTLDMKNGFTWQGFELDGRFGSRGRRQASMQHGLISGPFATYMAMEALGDDGYRQFSGAHIKRFYGDVGYRGESGEIHANVTLANNKFGVSGPAPVDLTNLDESAVFTTPQTIKNTLSMFDVNGVFQATPTWKLFGDIHYRAFDQARVDGNTTEFECEANESLCESDAGDTNIPNFFNGQVALGAIDRTWTRSRTIGGTVQATNDDVYFGFHNKITFGVSYDHGWTAFSANEELGIIQPNLVVGGFGYIVEEQATGISSVSVRAANDYLGVYALDSLDLTDDLKVTAGARFNRANIALYDMRGTTLNGNGVFTRINPVAGLTYKILPNVSAYASYSEANRAPTPLELGCADPNRPCLIDNFLVADPPLKQVEAQTIEAGFRGDLAVPTILPAYADALPGNFNWSLGVFRTYSFNDILSVPSAINGRGYFTNAGTTLRQGVESSFRYTTERVNAFLNYTHTDATFRSTIVLGAPDNPLTGTFGTGGSILVTPGANLTSVPRHRFKTGIDFAVTPLWKVGADFQYSSGPYIRGDEINLAGRLPSYGILNLRTSYQLGPNIQVYGLLENVTNTRARSFGTFFDTNDISFLAFNNPRMVSIGPPLGVYGGVKITY
ncbi:TonB-dependent receptor [Methylocystis sp.]|uniref:TonB-dependent receptor n=1 Tax=Methylocystis sp. TaxID=1911079 RepID=UPI0027351B8D|nr:TonB-dependent receptor [Methylocystis sp.]MDP3554221.1 TonB-dependent receptor [Methylocystis sp.]